MPQENCYIPRQPLFGDANVTPLFGVQNIPLVMGGPTPCQETVRDSFAMAALQALGADPNYPFTRTEENRQQSVVDAYAIADLMITQRLK